MRNNIVEGEPGIFPDPIARLLTRLGRLASRKKRHEPTPPPPPGTAEQAPQEAGGGPDQATS